MPNAASGDSFIHPFKHRRCSDEKKKEDASDLKVVCAVLDIAERFG